MGQRPSIEPRGVTIWHVAIIASAAAAVRIPIWLSSAHITFDEGVFFASIDLAASGLTQFKDFFSSQGPLFLPLLQLSDLLGFGDPRGARTLMVLSGIGIAVACYFIFSAIGPRSRALALSVLVATSGTVLYAAGPIQSEGPALALALGALAVTMHRSDNGGALIAGVLMGAAVAVKSLHVLPTLAMVGLVLVYRRAWLNLAYSGLAAITVALGSALVYGVERVWDQYVLFHLAKDNSTDLLENLTNLGSLLLEKDAPLIIAFVFLVVPVARTGRRDSLFRNEIPAVFGLIWLGMTLVVVLGFTRIDGGFTRVLAFLIPPIATILATYLRAPARVIVWGTVVAVLFQWFAIDLVRDYSPEEVAAIDRLGELDGAAVVITDDPGIAWAAGHLSHPDTVDPSFARFNTGYLTPETVEMAAIEQGSCAFLSISERFGRSGVDPPNLYEPTTVDGLYIRPGC